MSRPLLCLALGLSELSFGRRVNIGVRRVCLAFALALGLVVPEAVSRGPEALHVIEASRFVGSRFDRVEWLDTRTGSTRQESVGGPWTSECPLTVVSDGRLVSWRECTERIRERVRHDHVWYTADFLLARRLLRTGDARIAEVVNVSGSRALRVRLPRPKNPAMPIRWVDVEPASKLPLRLVYVVEGRSRTERVYLRRLPRSALPRDFFEP